MRLTRKLGNKMAVLDCNQTLLGFLRSTDLVPILLAYIIGTNLASLNASVTKNLVNPFVSVVFNGNRLEHNYLLLREGKKSPYSSLEDALADQDAIVLGYGLVLSEILSLFIIILAIFFIFKLVCSVSKLKELSMKKA